MGHYFIQKTVSSVHIGEQYNRFMGLVDSITELDLKRREALHNLYSDYKTRLMTAPASSKVYFHNAYDGGYLDHVLNVVDTARLMAKFYKHQGGLIDFSDNELVFVALHHDLGKLGDEEGPMYEVETDAKWRDKGYVYKAWGDGQQFITTTDRTLYLLQKYGVAMSKKEYLAIKLTDGLYEDTNARYLKNDKVFPHRTSLFYIVHWADHMAAMIEKDAVRAIYEGNS